MAIYHLHVSSGSKSSGKGAGGKARYLLREGPYAKEVRRVADGSAVREVVTDKRAELVHAESGNMPSWAAADPSCFWDASDAHERANGCIYREVEVALPEELSPEQQIALARGFAQEVATVDGGVTPWTLAVHQQDPAHPEHRHVHILLSDRIMDGVERDAVTLFRQPNAKVPGARKTRERLPIPAHKDDKGKEVSASAWTDRVRPLWEGLANEALERAGVDAQIDHRTLEAQREAYLDMAATVGEEDPRRARQYAESADALDRPPAPKKGRVLTHAGSEQAPERAAMVIQYEQAKAGRQAVIEARRRAQAELQAAQEAERRERIEQTRERRHARRVSWEIRERWSWREQERELRRQAELAAERERVKAERRQQIQERAMLRHGYRMDAWEIRERWVWRQQEREMQRQADLAVQRYEADQARMERESEEVDEAVRGWFSTEPWAPLIAGAGGQKTPWQEWREKTLAERYGMATAERAVEQNWYIRMRPDLGGLNIHDSQGRGIIDTGAIVKAEHPKGNRDIPLMLELAKAKGWSELMIEGSDDFRLAAASAALQAGFSVSDKVLEKGAGQHIEAERQELLTRKNQPTQDPVRSKGPGDDWGPG